MKPIRYIISINAKGIPVRLKHVLTRFGSLVLLLQRMPVVQMLFPEANILGGGSLANSFALAVTTVAGLGAFDSVAGQTTIDQTSPILGSTDVPATVSASLNFIFQCTNAPSQPESWSSTALPAGLALTYTSTTPAGVYSNHITGTPGTAGSYPVTITVWKDPFYAVPGDSVPQLFNIYVLGFATQPAATTTISSGGTTTLNCSFTGKPPAATLTYQWHQGSTGVTTTPVGTNSSTYTTPGLSASTNYWVKITSVLSSSTVAANSHTATVTVTMTAYNSWAAGLPTGQSGPGQTPQNDGVTNLAKFAFNMNPLAPDVRRLSVGGNAMAGLPGSAVVGGKLRLEFLRRKASTNPGITYTAQFGSNLVAWTDVPVGTPAGTSIDATWERVVVDDPTVGATKSFGRVKVLQTP